MPPLPLPLPRPKPIGGGPFGGVSGGLFAACWSSGCSFDCAAARCAAADVRAVLTAGRKGDGRTDAPAGAVGLNSGGADAGLVARLLLLLAHRHLLSHDQSNADTRFR